MRINSLVDDHQAVIMFASVARIMSRADELGMRKRKKASTELHLDSHMMMVWTLSCICAACNSISSRKFVIVAIRE